MATKDEIKAKLDKAGIEYPSNANKDELEALLPEEESEEGEDGDVEESEEGETEEGEDGEDTETEEDFEDATGEVTKMGIYQGEALVAVYNVVNHGKDFVKLAKAKAKAIGGVAKPYVDPAEPEVEKTVVNIVNKSGSLVRQFALSSHGKDYAKLADAFVEKYGEKKGLHIQQ